MRAGRTWEPQTTLGTPYKIIMEKIKTESSLYSFKKKTESTLKIQIRPRKHYWKLISEDKENEDNESNITIRKSTAEEPETNQEEKDQQCVTNEEVEITE